ncbi:VOC family protein [Spirosoma sp. SC4-14]|uniref:VOC family protein n=1 Tax=Spirosoma sp. SC4-14 TaxID=3128900 RepID=UPI0030D09B7F
MATKIFVNLPVSDLNRSVEFFTKLGYRFNPQFTDEKATCMIISEDIYAMLLVKPFFQSFIKKEIADTTKVTQTVLCLSADSREAVDELVDKAIAAGATTVNGTDDQGFMYSRDYEDLDGHNWSIMYMDPAAIEQEQPVAESGAV